MPVVYQQDTEALTFAAVAQPPASAPGRLPEEALDGENPYGFIGRDGALLEIERALRRPVPAILIHGLGGVGKTTLARGLVAWLAATEGLGDGCRWLSFHDIRSAEYVFNQLGGPVLGDAFLALRDVEQKIEALVRFYKKHRFLLVWDNFEVVAGSPESPTTSTMSEGDRQHLRSFLQRLRGAPTKVLITSRSEEAWLGTDQRRKVSLGGLHGEERWAYCEALLGDLGIAADRTDEKLVDLMDLLGGHPLAMRAILPRLESCSAGQIAKVLQSNLAALGEEGDEALRKLHATLQFVEAGLPEDLGPLLVPLGLHERYVDGGYLAAMAARVDVAWTREQIDRFLGALVHAGLLRNVGRAVYEMHPALSGFLRSGAASTTRDPVRDGWRRAFVDVMGRLADALATRELHEQRAAIHVHSVNFYSALVEAERLDMATHQVALTLSIADHAYNTRSFAEAEQLSQRLSKNSRDAGDSVFEAAAYHQLGLVAQERRDFATAEHWYLKSLEIKEKHGNERDAASTYHQLGSVALERRDFRSAERWYFKAIEFKEKHGNERDAASTYHQLGMAAQERRDFRSAERWYLKALDIFEKYDNEYDAASTYHQLGIVAGLQSSFQDAGRWLIKSIQEFAKCHDPENAHKCLSNFRIFYDLAPAPDQAVLKQLWEAAGLGELPPPPDPSS
ncbi:tetratricopeptide repeat protein [Sorangium sp. So ce302]|uniref:tetratricopeptide repeat protein n=1 Tax=Sorangium sp. So ce302 TaxID=3133297 RepID=UPI003F610835